MNVLNVIFEIITIVGSIASIFGIFLFFKFNNKSQKWLKSLFPNIKDRIINFLITLTVLIVFSSIIIGFFIVASKFGSVEIEVAKAEKILVESNSTDNINNFISLKNQQKTWSIIFILYGTGIIAFFIWLYLSVKKFIPEFYISDIDFSDRTKEEQKKIIGKELKDIKYKVERTNKAYRKFYEVNQLLMTNISHIELLINYSDMFQIKEIDEEILKLYKDIRESVKNDHQLYYESIREKDKSNERMKKYSSNDKDLSD